MSVTPRSLANLRPFRAGVSGNPGGQPKERGIMASVRKRYGDRGNRLIDALHLLVFGTPAERRAFFGESVKVSAKDRRDCLEILLERGYGKVVPEVPAARGESQPLTVNIIGISRPPKLDNAHRALPVVDVPATEDSATGREVTDKPSVRNPCETHPA